MGSDGVLQAAKYLLAPNYEIGRKIFRSFARL